LKEAAENPGPIFGEKHHSAQKSGAGVPLLRLKGFS
jgi:hypothetical protein